ncbi:MAG: hypothetical protein ACI4U9_03600 [Clostridia bacterium]
MGMPEVYDEIFDYAENHIKNNSKYSPHILKIAPEETKVFPLVVIKEVDNILEEEDLTKGDQKFKIEYEIEIYAIDKGNISKQIIIQELKKLINEVFDNYFGMYRRACITIPNVDRNVEKLYMRFNAIIDENKVIYRR